MEIDITTTESDGPWEFQVTLRDDDTIISEHEVIMNHDEYDRFGGHAEPIEVIRALFRFLLDRESPDMILERFKVTEAVSYFPDVTDELEKYFDE